MIKAVLISAVVAAVMAKSPLQTTINRNVALKVQIGEKIIEEPIVIGLFGRDVPMTVDNFYEICTNRNIEHEGIRLSYIGSIFHRIIPGFMIQGGDITNHNGTGGMSIFGPKFDDENFKVDHEAGVVSMANAGPDSNNSQFFITTADTPWLNGKHTVFGQIMQGMDIVYEIEKQGTASGQPKQKVKIIDCFDPAREAEEM